MVPGERAIMDGDEPPIEQGASIGKTVPAVTECKTCPSRVRNEPDSAKNRIAPADQDSATFGTAWTVQRLRACTLGLVADAGVPGKNSVAEVQRAGPVINSAALRHVYRA